MLQTQNKTTSPAASQIIKNPAFYVIISVFVVGILSVFLVWPKYAEFSAMKEDLNKINLEIDGDQESGQIGKQAELATVEANLNEEKNSVDQVNQDKEKVLNEVFPPQEKIYDLTKLFESYALKYNSKANPFELTSINFSEAESPTVEQPQPATGTGAAVQPQTTGSGDVILPYKIIQINLPLTLGEKNFVDFMNFIKKSGSTKEEDIFMGDDGTAFYVPIMTVESLSFSVDDGEQKQGETASAVKTINANFVLNTYIRSGSGNVAISQ